MAYRKRCLFSIITTSSKAPLNHRWLNLRKNLVDKNPDLGARCWSIVCRALTQHATNHRQSNHRGVLILDCPIIWRRCGDTPCSNYTGREQSHHPQTKVNFVISEGKVIMHNVGWRTEVGSCIHSIKTSIILCRAGVSLRKVSVSVRSQTQSQSAQSLSLMRYDNGLLKRAINPVNATREMLMSIFSTSSGGTSGFSRSDFKTTVN